MKKIILIIFLLSLSACAYKDINIVTVKLDNALYAKISEDTIKLLGKYTKPNTSSLIIFSKENDFLEHLEQHLRIAGYAVFVTSKETDIKKDDYEFGYVLDTINKRKVKKNVIKTLRYTFKLNQILCSKLYEVNNNKELLFASDWVCYLGE